MTMGTPLTKVLLDYYDYYDDDDDYYYYYFYYYYFIVAQPTAQGHIRLEYLSLIEGL